MGGERDDRGWDGWMASLTRWTWVWASSGSGWRTGKPGVLQSMGSQRGDTTEWPNWTKYIFCKWLNSDHPITKQVTLASCTCLTSISVQVTMPTPIEWTMKTTQGKNRAGRHFTLCQPGLSLSSGQIFCCWSMLRQKNLMIKLFAGAQVWSFRHQLRSYRYLTKGAWDSY